MVNWYITLVFAILTCQSCGQNKAERHVLEVTLVKALDMRCQYVYDFSAGSLQVNCASEDGDSCQSEIKVESTESYLAVASSIKNLKEKKFEFNNIPDGGFLKITLIEGEYKESVIVKNFELDGSSLKSIDKDIALLYEKLDSYKCE